MSDREPWLLPFLEEFPLMLLQSNAFLTSNDMLMTFYSNVTLSL